MNKYSESLTSFVYMGDDEFFRTWILQVDVAEVNEQFGQMVDEFVEKFIKFVIDNAIDTSIAREALEDAMDSDYLMAYMTPFIIEGLNKSLEEESHGQ